MFRVLKWVTGFVAALVVGVGAVALAARFTEPIGPFPGATLSGELITTPVQEWEPLLPDGWVQLQVGLNSPRSVTVGYLHRGGALYIPALRGQGKTWTEMAMQDDRVVLRIDQSLYPLRAVRVTDPDEMRTLVRDVDRPDGWDGEDLEAITTWYFRLEARLS